MARRVAIEQAEQEFEQYACRCSKCNKFGIVTGTHVDLGIIYRCSCQPMHWVINPETGEKIESSESSGQE